MKFVANYIRVLLFQIFITKIHFFETLFLLSLGKQYDTFVFNLFVGLIVYIKNFYTSRNTFVFASLYFHKNGQHKKTL